LLIAAGASSYGDWLTTVALVVLLYRTTGSVTAPALYILARVAPRVFGPAPGGVLADRFGPARVAAVCAVTQGVLTVSIVVFAHGAIIWAIYVAVAAAQFLGAMAQPAYSAIIPRVVRREGLARINAVYSAIFESSILVAPAIGALLLPHVTAELLITLDAMTFFVAAGLLLSLHMGPAAASVVSTARRGISSGVSIVLRDGMMRSLAAAHLSTAIVVTALQAVLVLAAAQRFGHDTDLGWLYAAVGAGGIAGSLAVLRWRAPSVGRGIITAATLLELVPLALFAVTGNFALALFLLFASSFGAGIYQTLGAVGLQQRVPAELLGRANAVIRFSLYLGMLIGAVAAAVLVQLIGWVAVVLLVSAGSFAFLLIVSATAPRTADAPDSRSLLGRRAPRVPQRDAAGDSSLVA
jgi:DHA3 family macrolide efflux protein-like MFS transporter